MRQLLKALTSEIYFFVGAILGKKNNAVSACITLALTEIFLFVLGLKCIDTKYENYFAITFRVDYLLTFFRTMFPCCQTYF